MQSLNAKDFIIAVALALAVYLFGGFIIGFLGAAIGIEKSYSTIAYVLLVAAAPIIYLIGLIKRRKIQSKKIYY